MIGTAGSSADQSAWLVSSECGRPLCAAPAVRMIANSPSSTEVRPCRQGRGQVDAKQAGERSGSAATLQRAAQPEQAKKNVHSKT